MKKALIVASIGDFLGFEKNDIMILQKLGYEVTCAANFDLYHNGAINELAFNKVNIPFERAPLNKANFKAYRMLKKKLCEEKYDLVHCHTPVGGAIARLVCKKHRNNGELKVIYTAHGFHFFKGAPMLNWILYYPIEKLLSKYTDILITINKEDYKRAKNKFYTKKIEYIPGVGIDIEKFNLKEFDKIQYRKKLELEKEDFVILSSGELSKRKNHEVVIKAIKKLNNPRIKYIIAGQGNLKKYFIELIKINHLNEQIQLLNYRSDMPELCNISDLYVFPSIREGLGLAAIEAMASGLPIITSNINGINDYSINGITGYSYSPNDVDGFAEGIRKLYNNSNLRTTFGNYNMKKAKEYDIKKIDKIMSKIYKSIV